jgi:hypothetical protein
MRIVLRAATVAVLLGASTMGWVTAAGAAPPAAADLPSSLHGAVETQAITVGNGAAALLVDPGTAYAYSTLDRDDYGGGSVNFTMTARGADLNLGTIAYSVLWAAPSCDVKEDPNAPNVPCVLSGGVAPGTAPNTGLQEAKGFPFYAEALYPPPPADTGQAAQDRVYKCLVNKDGPGSPPTNGEAASICKQSDAIPMTAWAEAIGDEYRSTGYSRVGGTDLGLVKVAASESFSQVQPIEGGKLIAEGYSVAKNISLLGGQITIDAVRSSARVVSNANGDATRDASCTFAGLKVEGHEVSTNGSELPFAQLQPMLKQIADSTGYSVELIGPTPVLSQVIEGSQQFVSCSGMQIKITDTHTESPVPVCLPVAVVPQVPQCVPALANREEFSFGRITIQQAVNKFAAFGGGDSGLVGGVGLDNGTGASNDVLGSSDLSSTGGPSDLGLGAGTGSQLGAGSLGSGNGNIGTGGIANAAHTVNSASLGMLAAVSSLAWLVAILVLVGVVNSLATGRSLRLPGF